MKYTRFEDVPVWLDSIQFAVDIYSLTNHAAFRRQLSFRDQIERAAVSVSNNIAEGFERGTTQETLTFLYIAKGSAGEVRSMLSLLERLPAFCDLRSKILDLKQQALSISRQLRAWSNSLQNTEIRGQRYLNERTRAQQERKRDREEFLKELEQIRLRAAAQSKAAGQSKNPSETTEL